MGNVIELVLNIQKEDRNEDEDCEFIRIVWLNRVYSLPENQLPDFDQKVF